MNLTYGYNATAGQMGAGSTVGNAGQLVSISGTIGGLTESAGYTYDDLGRLVTSNQTSNGSSAQRRFAYDRWGNRTGVWNATSGGTQIQSITLQQSGGAPTNRITSVTSGSTVNYTYDAAGSVTNDGAHSYGYDSENRVVSVDGGSTASYAYDNQNRRYKKTVGSAVTHYVWQGSQVIGEYDGTTGGVQYNYVYSGSRLLSKIGFGVVNWFVSDRLSTRLMLDGSGNVIGRQGHLPFGEDFGESGTQEKHHFTSYERDGESGTDYSVNRQYGQSVGRFMRVDPLASSARLEAPQSWNRYSYVLNEPVDQVDPLGLEENPEYCPPWLQSCDHLIPGGSGFSGGVSYDPGAGPYDGRPRSPVQVPRRPPQPPPCVQTQLPESGLGFYTYSPGGNRFGRHGVIQALIDLALNWYLSFGTARIGIGDISRQGGGPFPPHASHRQGLDVDIRPLRSDLREEPVTYRDPNYSRALTQQLVDQILQLHGVRVILFNDPNINGVTPWPGHDNHLHVSFEAEDYPCP